MCYNRLMTTYNWQLPGWPHFQYDLISIHPLLISCAEKMGFINGQFTHLASQQQTEAIVDLMVEEAIKTSNIEGEVLRRADVRSSIKNKLGLNQQMVKIHDQRARGIAELLLDARATFNEPLTETKLSDWHLLLISGSMLPNLRVGVFRTHAEPMQIISGHHGRERVHFEALPSSMVPHEMELFLDWFNQTAPGEEHAIHYAPVRAALAHLYFESIHPYEDGNGRIGRAIAEKALSQGCGYPVVLSLSQAIDQDKPGYYQALQTASRTMEVTTWIHYFVQRVLLALQDMEKQIHFIVQKSHFFDQYAALLNERQLKVIKRMLQAGSKGFEGGMSAKKYIKIAETSKATATRDLQHLHAIHAFKQIGSGRGVRYELNFGE